MVEQKDGRTGFRWGFPSAVAVILFVVCVGQAVGVMLEGFGSEGVGARGWVFLAFAASSLVWLWLQRAALVRFFRSMHVGVSLVTLSGIAVAIGVLVPQIDGFEDPQERVTEANYESQYKAFRWAEGYFLYHLMHPYGIGLPEAEIPAPALASLEKFGHRYGEEERSNREKQMRAAFSGMQKTKEIGAFVNEHDAALRRFFDVSTALHLNRTYKSHWFATLLGMLAIGIAVNTFKGRPSQWFSMQKVGYFTVHIGVLVMLGGGAISKAMTDRGILHLDLRQPPTDVYWGYHSPDKERRMPFALKLERFARKDWKTLQVWFAEDEMSSDPPSYTLWPGRKVELDYVEDGGKWRPRIQLEVRSLHERARVLPARFFEAERPAEGSGPLAALRLVESHDAPHDDDPAGHQGAHEHEKSLFLAPRPPFDVFADPQWRYRIKPSFGTNPDAARSLFPEDEEVLGRIAMRLASGNEVEPTVVPFRLGERIDAPGGYAIEVQEATANFRLDAQGRSEVRDPRPLAEQAPVNPGIWVRITPPYDGKPERRLLLESVDWVEMKEQQSFDYADLVLQVDWERWKSPGPPRFVLHWGSPAGALLLGEDGSRTEVPEGAALPLPGGAKLVADRFLANATFDKDTTKRVDFVAPHVEGPHFNDDFYSTDPTGLELVVTTDAGTGSERTETIRMASTDEGRANLWQSHDRRFILRYYTNSEAFPFEWRSVLSVWDHDADGRLYKVDAGDEHEREIRVNDYFKWKGYRFFQTNAIPEMPTYSGIGVVYDPGIPMVLTGMYTIILGTVLAFLVRPIVRAYGRGSSREAA